MVLLGQIQGLKPKTEPPGSESASQFAHLGVLLIVYCFLASRPDAIRIKRLYRNAVAVDTQAIRGCGTDDERLIR